LEPLLFLAGIGLGLGKYIVKMEGVPYIEFLASGLLITAAMFTSSFECSFGTFIRLEYDKVYDGMMSAPVSANNLLVGEILWAGTKGFFFTLCVLIIISAFQILPIGRIFPTPLIGFLTGTMFASISFLVTSVVKDLNHFNFYFTAFISPMFFFSGVVFPIEQLPTWLRPIAEILPLTHPVRLCRAMSFGNLAPIHLLDLGYLIAASLGVGAFAVRRLKKRLID
jgi:lipooligosaccharide transport system permease protein